MSGKDKKQRLASLNLLMSFVMLGARISFAGFCQLWPRNSRGDIRLYISNSRSVSSLHVMDSVSVMAWQSERRRRNNLAMMEGCNSMKSISVLRVVCIALAEALAVSGAKTPGSNEALRDRMLCSWLLPCGVKEGIDEGFSVKELLLSVSCSV